MSALARILVAVGLLHASLAVAQDMPVLPAHCHLQSLGDGLHINGAATRVFSLHSRHHLDRVMNDIHQSSQQPFRHQSAGPWQVLSHLSHDRLVTIQLRSSRQGGTAGLVAIRARPFAETVAPALPSVPGMHLHQWLESDDLGQRSRTVVLMGNRPVAQPLTMLRDHFRQAGYQPIGPRALRLGDHGGSLQLSGPDGQVNVVGVAQHGVTMVTVITTAHP